MKRIIITIVLLVSVSAFASAGDIYPFVNASKQARFNKLSSELRCLVCQNESLADSTASLANDLRADIYRMINQGKTNQQIIQYLVKRYGNFILFKPAFNPTTYLIWIGPFVLLVIAFIVLLVLIRFCKKKRVALSEADKSNVRQLLED